MHMQKGVVVGAMVLALSVVMFSPLFSLRAITLAQRSSSRGPVRSVTDSRVLRNHGSNFTLLT